MLIIIIVGNKHILVNLRFGFCQGVLFQVEPISWWLSRFYGGSSTSLFQVWASLIQIGIAIVFHLDIVIFKSIISWKARTSQTKA